MRDIEFLEIDRSENLETIEAALSVNGMSLPNPASPHDMYLHYRRVAQSISAFVQHPSSNDRATRCAALESLIECFDIISKILHAVIDYETRPGTDDEGLDELVRTLRSRIDEAKTQRDLAVDLIAKNNARLN